MEELPWAEIEKAEDLEKNKEGTKEREQVGSERGMEGEGERRERVREEEVERNRADKKNFE